MSGDQSILNDHGACASVISPTTRMSTSIERIQSGMAIQTSPSGKPDAKDRSATDSVRHDVIAAKNGWRVGRGESLTRFMLGSGIAGFNRTRSRRSGKALGRAEARPRMRSVAVERVLAGVLVGAGALVLADAERRVHQG